MLPLPKLGLPTIPVIIREFIDEIDSREIELMENVLSQGLHMGGAGEAGSERIDERCIKSKHG
jgi:hypothetical protein